MTCADRDVFPDGGQWKLRRRRPRRRSHPWLLASSAWSLVALVVVLDVAGESPAAPAPATHAARRRRPPASGRQRDPRGSRREARGAAGEAAGHRARSSGTRSASGRRRAPPPPPPVASRCRQPPAAPAAAGTAADSADSVEVHGDGRRPGDQARRADATARGSRIPGARERRSTAASGWCGSRPSRSSWNTSTAPAARRSRKSGECSAVTRK